MEDSAPKTAVKASLSQSATTLNRFSRRLTLYEEWRIQLAEALTGYQRWYESQTERDTDEELRIFELLESLHQDKLTIAMVGEFSRGKTELINAIFFADHKRRLLPSTPGRTTMCPTEILYNSKQDPNISLLPIESRKSPHTVQDLKKSSINWTILPLNTDSPDEMAETLQELVRTKTVSIDEARELGFSTDNEFATGKKSSVDMDIPVWRHAVVNYPHSLLKQGLVILDTPGLNALGSEPELTLNMLPTAHAVLFVLAADTGVTSSDLKIWKEYVCAATYTNKESRIATLNKIDTLWDELVDEAHIQKNIQKQTIVVARRLEINPNSVFPISAHKGLLGKVKNNTDLINRSGLLKLEAKLSGDIVTYKKELLRGKIEREIGTLVNSSRQVIVSQLKEAEQEYRELASLRGQNREVIDSLINKLQTQRNLYTKEVNSFHTTRHLLVSEVQILLGLLSLSRFDAMTDATRQNLKGSWTTQGIRGGMADMFTMAAKTLARVDQQAAKIRSLVEQIYLRFHREHGLTKIDPERFSVQPFTDQFAQLERDAVAFRNSARMIMTEQTFVVRNFFITLASRAREIFSEGNAATRNWSKSILSPIYTQIQEHKIMIDRRLENLEKLKVNHSSLEERIGRSADRIRELRNHLALVDNILKKLYGNQKTASGRKAGDQPRMKKAAG